MISGSRTNSTVLFQCFSILSILPVFTLPLQIFTATSVSKNTTLSIYLLQPRFSYAPIIHLTMPQFINNMFSTCYVIYFVNVSLSFSFCSFPTSYYYMILTCYIPSLIQLTALDRCVVREPKDLIIRSLVACLPAWWRFAQCVRRYFDEGRRANPHLLNAGKYSTVWLVVIFSTMTEWTQGKPDERVDTQPYTWSSWRSNAFHSPKTSMQTTTQAPQIIRFLFFGSVRLYSAHATHMCGISGWIGVYSMRKPRRSIDFSGKN